MQVVLDTLKGIAFAITDPYLLFLLFLIGLKLQRGNRKTILLQRMIIGQEMNTSLELTFSQIVIGLFGGVLGSIILNSLGVTFENRIIIYILFFFSILLMYVKSKFICFSYSGSVLGFIIIILNYLKVTNFKLGSLIILVGVMHIVEGILVIIDGNRGAVPIFTNKKDKVIGGFSLTRYWTVPIAFLNILPFYSVIGYKNITFTKTKKQKAIISGTLILIYGISVCIMALFTDKSYMFQIFSLILLPSLHELMMYIDDGIELRGKPLFISNEDGLRVLEVAPNSQAFHMGIESGDILMEINNKLIKSDKEIFKYLRELQNFVWIKIKKKTGEVREISYNKFNNSKRLGLVLVPKNITMDHEVVKISNEKEDFKTILENIKKKQEDKKK